MLHFQVELVRTNLKLPFLDSSHTNNHLYIIYQSIMEMLTYFHRMSLNKNCGCMIFSVAYPYRKSMSIIERVIYIHIYISSSWHHIFAIPPVFIEIYLVGDNRRPVNSSTSLYISDQLGTENVWETLLCWLIVVLWVRKNMYRRERHFGSFHRYSSLLMFPIAQSNLPKLAVGMVGAAQRHHYSWNAYLTSMFGHYIGGYIIN